MANKWNHGDASKHFEPSMVHSEPNAQVYVLGFAFTNDLRCVTLIEKKKPAWQAGKLNGVGGKVEKCESPLDAMCREFAEETGVSYTRHGDWHLFEILRFQNGAVVYCFATKLIHGAEPRTMEEEDVLVLHVIPKTGQVLTTRPMINNLLWLVPKAYHQIKEPKTERMIVAS